MFKGAVSAYRGKGDGEQQGDDREMMEREGKTLRDWSCDQLELKCQGKADSLTSCTVVDVLVHDHFV